MEEPNIPFKLQIAKLYNGWLRLYCKLYNASFGAGAMIIALCTSSLLVFGTLICNLKKISCYQIRKFSMTFMWMVSRNYVRDLVMRFFVLIYDIDDIINHMTHWSPNCHQLITKAPNWHNFLTKFTHHMDTMCWFSEYSILHGYCLW